MNWKIWTRKIPVPSRQPAQKVRQWIMDTPLQPALESAIRTAYETMQKRYGDELAVAVRSSATAEDLPDASFAGQQETFLKRPRAGPGAGKIARRVCQPLQRPGDRVPRPPTGSSINDVALSAGVQLMVRSGTGAAGVLFTLDTESGYRDVVFVTSSYGLGESVVQGAVNPDEFYLFKPNRARRPAGPCCAAH